MSKFSPDTTIVTNCTFFGNHNNSSSPLQVMTALSVCGTWRVKPASKSSRPIERSSRSRSTMWRFIRLNATSPAPGQMLSPRCSYDAELHFSLQPRSVTQPPMIVDQQRRGRGRTFRHGSSPTSHSPPVLSRTGRLCSRQPETGLDSPQKGSAGRAVRRTALQSPIYHPGRPGCDGSQRHPPQTDLNLTSLARRLRTSVTECLEWRNEVSSQSSAPVTSRSSQIPLALDLHLSDKPGPGPLLQVRFCVVLFQNVGY